MPTTKTPPQTLTRCHGSQTRATAFVRKFGTPATEVRDLALATTAKTRRIGARVWNQTRKMGLACGLADLMRLRQPESTPTGNQALLNPSSSNAYIMRLTNTQAEVKMSNTPPSRGGASRRGFVSISTGHIPIDPRPLGLTSSKLVAAPSRRGRCTSSRVRVD